MGHVLATLEILDNPGNTWQPWLEDGYVLQGQKVSMVSISLKEQVRKNLQEYKFKLEDFLLSKTFNCENSRYIR